MTKSIFGGRKWRGRAILVHESGKDLLNEDNPTMSRFGNSKIRSRCLSMFLEFGPDVYTYIRDLIGAYMRSIPLGFFTIEIS